MVAPSHRARTAPAATGQAAPRAAQWSVIPIVEACVMMWRHIPGIQHILREAPTVVAVKTTCAAQAVTGCSIVLPQNRSADSLEVDNGTMDFVKGHMQTIKRAMQF